MAPSFIHQLLRIFLELFPTGMIKLSTFNTVALTKIDAAFPEKPACVLADHFQAFKNKLSIAISCLACLSAFREKLIDCNEAAT